MKVQIIMNVFKSKYESQLKVRARYNFQGPLVINYLFIHKKIYITYLIKLFIFLKG
jgi:hypothetical protein